MKVNPLCAASVTLKHQALSCTMSADSHASDLAKHSHTNVDNVTVVWWLQDVEKIWQPGDVVKDAHGENYIRRNAAYSGNFPWTSGNGNWGDGHLARPLQEMGIKSKVINPVQLDELTAFILAEPSVIGRCSAQGLAVEACKYLGVEFTQKPSSS